MFKGIFMDGKASPLWLARRRIVVCSLIFEGALIAAIVIWGMCWMQTNPMLDVALTNLLYIFGATALGYTGIATWGDKNDMASKRQRDPDEGERG